MKPSTMNPALKGRGLIGLNYPALKDRVSGDLMKHSALGKKLDLATLELLSGAAEICPLQDPFRIRARYLGWKVALQLIDDQGELDRHALASLRKLLPAIPIGHESDAWLYTHLSFCLNTLATNEHVVRKLKRCSLPLCSKQAEELVRQTLWPEQIHVLRTAHVRRAVLAAWLTYLRQITGSCFATAPAMKIQREDPSFLLEDLDLILSAGEIRRGGVSVPMNPGTGIGELHRPLGGLPAPALPGIRSAFFAAGVPFDKIPLHGETAQAIIDQGLMAHFGITQTDLKKEKELMSPTAHMLWEKIGGHYTPPNPASKRLREWESARQKAIQAFLATADCALLRCWEFSLASFCDVKVEFARWNLYGSLGIHPDASPPGIGRFLQGSIQQRLDAVNRDLSRMQKMHQLAVQKMRVAESILHRSASESQRRELKAELTSQLYTINHLAGQIEESVAYAEWLSNCFSELLQLAIDRLQHHFQEVFEPALIGEVEQAQFEDSPAGFRLIFKHGRAAASSWERIESEQQFVDALCRFFTILEQEMPMSMNRKDTLQQIVTELIQYLRSEEFSAAAIERVKLKRGSGATPWAYLSGGTLQTLVQSYFDKPLEQLSRKIRSAKDLLAFVVESAKLLPAGKSYLMVSPNHAFLFYPDWVRPELDSTRFLKSLSIDSERAEYLQENLALRLPEEMRPLFLFNCRQVPVTQTVSSIRSSLLQGAFATKGLSEEAVDGFLYESLPLLTPQEAKKMQERIAMSVSPHMKPIHLDSSFVTPLALIEAMKKSLVASGAPPFSTTDWDQLLADAARKELLLYPHPILFADTNWSHWSFGFVQHFATGEWELWRLSRTAQRGAPMSRWKILFHEEETWSILL